MNIPWEQPVAWASRARTWPYFTLIYDLNLSMCCIFIGKGSVPVEQYYIYTVQKYKYLKIFWGLFYFRHQMLCGIVLQHDNARHYAARHTKQFLANNNVQMLPWPSMSPHLNTNKHTWNQVERRVQGSVNTPANVRELFQALKHEWMAIPAQVIHNLIQSMPKRC